jgi:SAM-dependent methyltransferase
MPMTPGDPRPANDADDIRVAQRALWDRFASGWEKWDDVVDSILGPVGASMISALHPSDDQNHLDVASGTGEPGLTIATLIPRGRITLTDIAPRMLDAARRRAASRSTTNIEFRECSADALPYPTDCFDSVSCRFGLMFVPDVRATVSELVRVLRPGGQLCVAVWAEPAANPWATIPATAIAAEVESPIPLPDAPGMFRCSARGSMTTLFTLAGLHDVEEWDVPTSMATDSPEQYWQLLTELTAPVVDALANLDDVARHRIARSVINEAKAFESAGTVRLPGKARCALGRK